MGFIKKYPLQNLKLFLQRFSGSFPKKSIFLILLFIGVVGLKFLTNQWMDNKKELFYTLDSSAENIQRVYKLFHNQQYLTLTSYIEQQLVSGVSLAQRPELLFYQAESYFQLAQYEIAKKKFQALLKEFPSYWRASLRLASINIIHGDLRDFIKMTKKLPESDELYYWKGRYYHLLGSFSYAMDNYYKSDMNDSRVNFQLGNLFYKQKKYDTAISFLEKAQSTSQNINLEISRLLFYSYVAKKDSLNAIKYSNAMKPYFSQNIELLQDIASTLYNIGEISQARSVYSILDTDNKITPEIAKILSDLSYELKDYHSVLRYAQYTKVNETTSLHVIESAYYLKKYIQTTQAIKFFFKEYGDVLSQTDRGKLLEIEADSYEKMYNLRSASYTRESIYLLDSNLANQLKLIELYKKLGYRDKLLMGIDRIYQENPSETVNLVYKLINLSEYPKAQELILKRLSLEPSNQELLFVQSKIYLHNKNWDKLRTTLHTLVQLPIKDPQMEYHVNYALGSLYIQTKNYLDAQLFMEKAKSLDNNKSVNIKLLLIYFLQKNYPQTKQQLDIIQSDVSFIQELTQQESRVLTQIEEDLKQIVF